MSTLNSPFLRIEVVCPVAQVFSKAKRYILVGQQHYATRSRSIERDSLVTKIGNSLSIVDVYSRIFGLIPHDAHSLAMVRYNLLALYLRRFYAVGNNL